MENFGIWVEVIFVFGGGMAFCLWQIYATNRDQRLTRERMEREAREKELANDRSPDGATPARESSA
jgi:hypothetical protein